MGGIFISAIVLISVFLWCNQANPLVWISLTCLLGFGAIGAWDDWKKICYNNGVKAWQKFSAQLLVALLVAGLWISFVGPSDQLYFPFFKHLHPSMGFLFIPWIMFVLIGTSNAVNLTDGLDGLAIGALLSNFAVFSIICYAAGHVGIAHYLHIPFAGTAELAIVGSALFGASLGFLWFNTYPAQIFMGDVGSLSLGAVLAFMALACKQELLLVIAGGLFVIETLSVIVQVLSYKFWGKRYFKMAPIHHHFELMGWKESKITIRFCIIAFVLSLLALMTLKIR
jgi:phospho-N-acetylmuramoyl-pentapeptide-transferase